MPIDQVVGPLEKRDSQDQSLVHGHHSQFDIKANRVHYHVNMHEFGAGMVSPDAVVKI